MRGTSDPFSLEKRLPVFSVTISALLIAAVVICSCARSHTVARCQDGGKPGSDGTCLADKQDDDQASGEAGSRSESDGNGTYGGLGTDGESGTDTGSAAVSGGEADGAGWDDSCVSIRAVAEPIEITVEVLIYVDPVMPPPVAVYIMLDHSSSMDDGTPSKWSVAVDAITAFANGPGSDFVDLALQFFPLPDPACDGAAYAAPAVPMGPLPENAANITAALAAPPEAGAMTVMTPLEPALRGMTSFCAEYQSRNPDVPCVGVLILDGGPTACDLDPAALAGIARDAFDDLDVMSFAVGMAGADLELLESIAEWGGTDCTPLDPDTHACEVTQDSGTTLLQALEFIREYAVDSQPILEPIHEIFTEILECEWGIPDPPEGMGFDPDRVNVVITAPGRDDLLVGRVSGESQCDAAPDGWYYDDPQSPTRVIACPGICDRILDVNGIEATLIFGCEYRVPE